MIRAADGLWRMRGLIRRHADLRRQRRGDSCNRRVRRRSARSRVESSAADVSTNSVAREVSDARLSASAIQSLAIASRLPSQSAALSREASRHTRAVSMIRLRIRSASKPVSIQERSRGHAARTYSGWCRTHRT